MKGVSAFFRREPVLVISAVAALLSMLAVPPGPGYMDYIDLRVLCLLFCLMAVVDGLKGCGLFAVMAQRLLTGRGSLRRVTMILVLLPFFTSMLVTNDVSLITFVPFAVLILQAIGRTDRLIPVIVLQTVAANLGSMATPLATRRIYTYTRNTPCRPGISLRLCCPSGGEPCASHTGCSVWSEGRHRGELR